MKSKRNNMAILGILLLLGMGYLIPTAIMKIEDLDLLHKKKSVEIEEIQLNSQEVDVMEELSVFSDMLSNNIIVEVGEGVKEEYQDAMQDVESSEEASLSQKLYYVAQDFLTLLDVKEELILEKFSAINYALMVGKKDERVYSVWSCIGYDEVGNPYYFWIDASTKMVMAFDVPYTIIGHSEEAFHSATNRLVNYYDFESYGCPIYTFAETESLISKNKYWSNDLLISNKNGVEQLSICVYKSGDRLMFNVHPGSASISYDAQ